MAEGVTGSRRILVIDDDADIRRSLERLLVEAGNLVEVAADGSDGVRALERATFDVVITDIVMPEQEGLETIREVRRRWPGVKIIAMSGAGAGATYLKIARAFGVDGVIAKPFRAAELHGVVESALAASKG